MGTSSWQQALDRTRRAALGHLARILRTPEIDDQAWQDLEAALIQADVGAVLSAEMISSLRSAAGTEGSTRAEQVHQALRNLLVHSLGTASPPETTTPGPQVWVLVGVNGSGKTTSAAKLAGLLKRQERRVLLAAADTYRAAAALQLQQWADRLGIEVIAGKPGSDPGAVAYEASQAALARGVDTLLIDTSGRMHTSHNLMAELQKVCRVAGKVIPGAPHRVILVLDATTGQNALSQARAFTRTVGVTEILLAKLDGSAKGGAAIAIHHSLGLPITYVGLGEGAEDLAPFDAEAYVDSLLAAG